MAEKSTKATPSADKTVDTTQAHKALRKHVNTGLSGGRYVMDASGKLAAVQVADGTLNPDLNSNETKQVEKS